jgi:uncharacterized damage-inducible protein DinB
VRPSDLQRLEDYDAWANAKILEQAARLTQEEFTAVPAGGYASVRDTLVHAISAERFWRAGWQTSEGVPDLDPNDFPTCASVTERWAAEDWLTRDYLSGLTEADLDAHLTGEFANDGPRGMTILHLLLHNMQHRTEAAMMLTAYGYSPGDIDLIFYLNERARQS